VSFTIYPSVDISEGRCVRPLQGGFGGTSVYSDDPVEVALGLGRAGARWLHIVDLDGARTGKSRNRALLLATVRAARCPVQAGGGLGDVDDVEELVAAGANRVLLGAHVLDDRAALRACARFADRLGATLDARGEGWTVGTGMPVLDAARRFEEAGVSLLVYTAAGRDGAMSGPDLQGARRVAAAASVPVVASGGISSLDEIRAVARLRRAGVVGAVVGRALYEHKFSVMQANVAADEAADDDE
jgi:phosphoribosylformimino-5-aminoimidazole carboxamide ribotide isomerase